MPAFEIRRACPGDASGVAEVWLRSRRAAVGYIPCTVHCDMEVRDWISRRILTQDECWVAHTHDGEIIGMLVIEEHWIAQLYVSPDYQGIGIGSAMVDLAKCLVPGQLQLWTFQTNGPAQRFYERHGFVCVEQTDGNHNEEHAPDMRYLFEPTGP